MDIRGQLAGIVRSDERGSLAGLTVVRVASVAGAAAGGDIHSVFVIAVGDTLFIKIKRYALGAEGHGDGVKVKLQLSPVPLGKGIAVFLHSGDASHGSAEGIDLGKHADRRKAQYHRQYEKQAQYFLFHVILPNIIIFLLSLFVSVRRPQEPEATGRERP